VIGKGQHLFAVGGDQLLVRIILVSSVRIADQAVDLMLGQAKYFAQLAGKGIVLKGGKAPEQAYVVFPILVENILDDLIAVLPGEIEIEIGRGRTVWD
jgi:hypothetical protein